MVGLGIRLGAGGQGLGSVDGGIHLDGDDERTRV